MNLALRNIFVGGMVFGGSMGRERVGRCSAVKIQIEKLDYKIKQ